MLFLKRLKIMVFLLFSELVLKNNFKIKFVTIIVGYMNTFLPLSSASLEVSQLVICLVQGCPHHHMEF